jgi:hypothetical protein
MNNCYFCKAEIKEVKYIEWIPLFFRYANVCEKCHREREVGDLIENIEAYEQVLAGKMHPFEWIAIIEKNKEEE